MTICTYVERIGRTCIFVFKYKEKIATYLQVYTVSIYELYHCKTTQSDVIENVLD